MPRSTVSETITENLFRDFYGPSVFIEKSAIPESFGFKSKRGTSYKGYPDFFKELDDYIIVVEAKATDHKKAVDEVKFYMSENASTKNILGIAVSGQSQRTLKVSHFVREIDKVKIDELPEKVLLSLDDLDKSYSKKVFGEMITTDALKKVLNELNKTFNEGNKIRDTDRSLFFSGIMIALKNRNFKSTYKNIQAPSQSEAERSGSGMLESHNLNEAIVNAIDTELADKINNHSKEYSWRDKFSFIKNVDYPLNDYKAIIQKIEKNIFVPFNHDEKQDILGRAYKIFLSRAGKVDNKNIILTPDHIKELMVKLARLSKDDVVLDTCTGSGGFLMESMETMIKLAESDPNKIENIREKQLIGFEVDPVLFALACSNMFLHGDGRTNLIFRSSLINNDSSGAIVNRSDQELFNYIRDQHPSKVIINPPYENNSAIQFVNQAIDYLDNNGKLIIIMPTPTLTHNQGGLTETILEKAKLDYVIKMPNNLFSEQKRTVNTSIFGFTKTPHSQQDDVLFYRLDDDGFVSVQHKGRVDKNGVWPSIENDILDCIFNLREKTGVAEKKKIYKDGILNCAGFKPLRSSTYKIKKISDLFDIVPGTLASGDAVESGDYDFITASEDWKKHDEYTHDTEGIVMAVAAGGSLGRTHYVNGKFVVSNLCILLTPKDNPEFKIDCQFYNCFFASMRKQLVDDLADGTSKLTIDFTDNLPNYYIDYVPYDEQIAFVNSKLKHFNEVRNKYIEEKKKMEKEISKLYKK